MQVKRRDQKYAIAGDFNASVGQNQGEDNPTTIGKHGFGEENARGLWLKQWCSLEDMCIANTMFPKPDIKKVTHAGISGNMRQIDFILVDKCLRKQLWI